MTDPHFEHRRPPTATHHAFLRGTLVALLLLACSAEHDAGYQATCTAMYQLNNGVRGPALNDLFPADGGRYCIENFGTSDCVGNYCKQNEGTTWTR